MLCIALLCCITLGTPVRVRTITGEEIRVLTVDEDIKNFSAFEQARDRALSEIKLGLQQQYDAFDVKFILDPNDCTVANVMFISEFMKIIYRGEIVAELPVDRSNLWQLSLDILAVREEQQRKSGFFIIARDGDIDFDSGTDLYEVLQSLQRIDRQGHSIFFEDKRLINEYYKNVLKRNDATKKQVGHILSFLLDAWPSANTIQFGVFVWKTLYDAAISSPPKMEIVEACLDQTISDGTNNKKGIPYVRPETIKQLLTEKNRDRILYWASKFIMEGYRDEFVDGIIEFYEKTYEA